MLKSLAGSGQAQTYRLLFNKKNNRFLLVNCVCVCVCGGGGGGNQNLFFGITVAIWILLDFWKTVFFNCRPILRFLVFALVSHHAHITNLDQKSPEPWGAPAGFPWPPIVCPLMGSCAPLGGPAWPPVWPPIVCPPCGVASECLPPL